MKLFQISLLVLFPISLLSQTANKFEIADSTINVNEILRDEFGDEIIKQIEQMSSMNIRFEKKGAVLRSQGGKLSRVNDFRNND